MLKNHISLLAILISVFLTASGQVFIKKGLNSLGNVDLSAGFISFYIKIFLSPTVILGSFLYFISVFSWLYALSKVDLSFAYPFISLSYVLILLFSNWFLGESITSVRWAGVFIICFGVLLISRS